MNIYRAIEHADRSAEPVGFATVNSGSVVGLRLEDDGNLVFANADTGAYMTQGLFRERYQYEQFTVLDTVPEIAGDDELEDDAEGDAGDDYPEYPDIDDALAWAEDTDNVSDEQVQAYLADVAGEDNRKRSRATSIKKVAEYVSQQ